MEVSDFVARYERGKTSRFEYEGELRDVMAPANRWSLYFGEVLHDYMSGQPIPEDCVDRDTTRYMHWMTGFFGTHAKAIFDTDAPDEQKYDALFSTNYHILNLSMSWELMHLLRANSTKAPASVHRTAQDMVAFTAVKSFIERERLASEPNRLGYFYDQPEDNQGKINANLGEADSAVILLEAARQHGWIVIPSPMQFEGSKKDNLNVDFLVFGPRGQVVGVQVKTSVTDATVRKYAEDIVLIDTTVDFGNQSARRTDRRSSDKKVVRWNGLIVARQTLDISTQGRSIFGTPAIGKEVLRLKLQAKHMVQDYTDERMNATRIIGNRVMKAFN